MTGEASAIAESRWWAPVGSGRPHLRHTGAGGEARAGGIHRVSSRVRLPCAPMLRARDLAGRHVAGLALAGIFGAAACSKHPPMSSSAPLRIAAASDLSTAFEELGASYEKATGTKVIFSFGATGLLERQIVEGAPFDVFLAADVSFVDDAIKAGACSPGSKQLYAVGRLAIVASPGAAFAVTSISDLADGRITRIAIANPEHAPYGRAARQAMKRAGVWRAVESKLVYGENVHQALQFAESGNADVAIVALALTAGRLPSAIAVPADLHDPIDQALVICARTPAAVRAAETFCAYVTSAPGRSLMEKYGFSTADASLPDPKRGSTLP